MRFIAAVVFSILFFALKAQTIEVKTDEFTKFKTAITSWEKFASGDAGEWNFSLRKIDKSIFLDRKLNGTYASIGSTSLFYFKLDNDSIISLNSVGLSQSCLGCGATGFIGSNGPGTKATFLLKDGDLAVLNSRSVVKVRIQTTAGYIEQEVRGKGVTKLTTAASLIAKEK